MISPPLTPAPVVQDWLARHGRPVSFSLHMIGIPLTLMGALLVPVYVATLSLPIFLFSWSLFLIGYLIQFLGHALEGTEPGEITYLRKKLIRSLRKRFRKSIATARQTPGSVA